MKIKQKLELYFERKAIENIEFKKEQLILSLHKNQIIVVGDTFYTIKRVKPFFKKAKYIKAYGKDVRND